MRSSTWVAGGKRRPGYPCLSAATSCAVTSVWSASAGSRGRCPAPSSTACRARGLPHPSDAGHGGSASEPDPLQAVRNGGGQLLGPLRDLLVADGSRDAETDPSASDTASVARLLRRPRHSPTLDSPDRQDSR